MENKSNIVSLSYKREEKKREGMKRFLRGKGDNSTPYLEERIALLEEELDKTMKILIETANLAEENRDYLIRMARLLKEK